MTWRAARRVFGRRGGGAGGADGLGGGRVRHDGPACATRGFCNVYGFRPTWGLVPQDAEGDVFLSTLSTEGPRAARLRMWRGFLTLLAGENPEVPFPRAVPDVLAGLERG